MRSGMCEFSHRDDKQQRQSKKIITGIRLMPLSMSFFMSPFMYQSSIDARVLVVSGSSNLSNDLASVVHLIHVRAD